MVLTALVAAPAAAPAARSRGATRTVLVQLLAAVGLYQLYAYARNAHGAASAEAWETAVGHADDVVALQSALRLPAERDLQRLVLDQEWLVAASGAYYGSAHFLVTAGVLLVVVLRRGELLARLGTLLATVTAVSVAVFALYPVAPPRLVPGEERTVDTLAEVGGLWSYDHGVLERISDPFAALPSLHLGWATWCACAVWAASAGAVHRRAWRVAAVAHPVLTLAAVLVTGNHWYVDAVAGTGLVLGVAAVQRTVRRRP